MRLASLAGKASWTWLQLAAMNAMYLGGGAERILSQAMKHKQELSPGQQELMKRTQELSALGVASPRDPIEVKSWGGIYTGPEVKKAYFDLLL